MADRTPLVLDVDGTFLRTDMLYECFWAGMGRAPLATLRACAAHIGDRAVLKHELARIAALRTDLLPVHPKVADLARAARDEGREVVLASASDAGLVAAVARDHGLSDRVFATTSGRNLKGAAKAAALVEAFGEGGFDYAGNEPVDRAIWDRARGAVVVGDHPAIAEGLRGAGKTVTEVPTGWTAADLVRALRPHQWVKNALLLVPMIGVLLCAGGIVGAAHLRLDPLIPVVAVLAAGLAADSASHLLHAIDAAREMLAPTAAEAEH